MNILITKLVYSSTIKHNSGAYEKLEAEGLVHGEAQLAFNDLKGFVVGNLTEAQSEPTPKEADTSKVLTTKGKLVEKEVEEEVVEEVVEEKPKKKGKAKGTKELTPKKGKNIPYDREDDNLKNRLTQILNTWYPDWKKDEATKAAAKKASVSLVGIDFLDSEGEVLESFMEEFQTIMESDDI